MTYHETVILKKRNSENIQYQIQYLKLIHGMLIV